MIDLRSDTCSRPTSAMREAMASATVGDDVYHDDPTINELEAMTAALLGKEDAVFMVTGTMTNQVAIRAHTEPGDAVLFDQGAHVYILEGGAPSAYAGVLPVLLPGVRGIFSADDVTASVGRRHPFLASTIPAPVRLLCVEQTHNIGGGSIWPKDKLDAVTCAATSAGLVQHLDGARLWHATAATGISEAAYASPFDTVSVCFSKALGAPMGSCLAGSAKTIARARRFKQQIGGGMRQGGIIAAGAIHALQHHRPRIGETHTLAKTFTTGIAALRGIVVDPNMVETNIVRFRLDGIDNHAFVNGAHARGLHMLPSGADGVRAVFYLDIGTEDVARAVSIIEKVLGEPSIVPRNSSQH